MAFSSCLCHPLTPLKIVCFRSTSPFHYITVDRRSTALLVTSTRQFSREGSKSSHEWGLVSGFEVTVKPKLAGSSVYRKGSRVNVSCLASLQIVSNVFTIGTVVVLPFYALMVVAPQARLTRKFMDSGIPYVVLGLLYAYLLYHSWTPDLIRYMFSSKYMLPELSGIAKMFSSETTLASAWIHLLTIDLFAARQVFWDGLENEVETRHSVSLCLLFCPLGVMAHVFTKALTQFARSDKHNM